MRFLNKLLSLFLAIAMVAGMVPAAAFAADTDVMLDDTQPEMPVAETERYTAETKAELMIPETSEAAGETAAPETVMETTVVIETEVVTEPAETEPEETIPETTAPVETTEAAEEPTAPEETTTALETEASDVEEDSEVIEESAQMPEAYAGSSGARSTENEPNGNRFYANSISAYDNVVYHGQLTYLDKDYFKFTITEADTVVSISIGATYSAYTMSLYDSKGSYASFGSTDQIGGGYLGYDISGYLEPDTYYLCISDAGSVEGIHSYCFSVSARTTKCTQHITTSKVTAPNCTYQGYTRSTCTVCGISRLKDFTDPSSRKHTYVNGSCSVCGATAMTWSLVDGTLTISGTVEMDDYSTYSPAPWYGSRNSITEVVIEEGITGIGEYAFSDCSKLTSVTIHGNASIDRSAFDECRALTSITIHGNASIGDWAFSECSTLTSVELLGDSASIGEYAFYNCSALTSVELLGDSASIGDYAFSKCSALTSVELPGNSASIGDYAFYNCSALTSVTIHGNASIGDYAFYNCSALTSVELPGNSASIGDYAFYNCSALTSVTIPENTTSIGEWAFSCCESLKRIYFLGKPESIGDDAFFRVTADAYYHPYDWRNASERIDYGGDLNWISYFSSCPHPKSEPIQAVEPTCTKEGWTEGSTCAMCETVLVAREKIPALGHNRVNGICMRCEVTAQGTCGTNVTWVLSTDNTLVISGTGAMRDYSSSNGSTPPWCGSGNSVKKVIIANGVTRIGSYAFYNCTELTSVSIPGSVTQMGNSVFRGCTALTTVTIPDSVTQMGNSAFYGCTALTAVTIPDGVTQIGDSVFYGCTALTAVTIPDSVTKIGDNVFRGCTALTTATIPDSVQEIGKCLFYECAALTSAKLPVSVTSLGSHTFYKCEALTAAALPVGITSITKSTFCYCYALTSVQIPEGITSLEDYAFEYCESLTEVTLPDSVTSIGQYAFGYCKALRAITIPAALTSFGRSTFLDCTSLSSVTIPENVTTMGGSMFAGCTDLRSVTFLGDKPYMYNTFEGITADVYYFPYKANWETAVGNHYGGTLNWIPNLEGCPHPEHALDAAIEPTCTATGLTEGKHCAICSQILIAQEIVPAKGHTEVVDAAVEPTTTKTGLTEGKHCSVCDVVLVAQIVLPVLPYTESLSLLDENGSVVSGTTVWIDMAQTEEFTLYPHILPENAMKNISWQLPANMQYWAEYTENKDGSLILRPRGKTGTISVLAKTEDGSGKTAEVSIKFCTLKINGEIVPGEDDADFQLFSGKNTTIKIYDSESNNTLTSKEIVWSMDEVYAPFAKLDAKSGKVTAQKVVKKERVEVVGTVIGSEGTTVTVTLDIYPAVTQVEILEGEEVVNNQTLTVDFDEESRTFTVLAHPVDTAQNVTWSISDAKKMAFASYTTDGNTLTVTNPTGESGTVTVKATVDAGVKKTVSFKLSFADYAQSVEITNTEETVDGGDSLQLTAVVTPDKVTKGGVTWSLKNAADKSVASVSKSGLLKTKAVYRDTPVTVVATSLDGLKKDEYTVTVTPKDTGMLILTLDGENVTKAILNIDLNTESALSLRAENLLDGSVAENITWKSSGTTIATVDDGMVLINKAGQVTITAKEEVGKKVLRKATVTLKISAMTSSITIEEPDEGLEVASGKAITLTATCKGGADKVNWTIVEGEQYAKITNKGKLTANKDITSAKEVVVRATAADGSGVYEEATVTIRPIAQGVQIYSEEGGRTLFSIRSTDNLWVRSNTTLEWAMNDVETLQLAARVYPSYEEGSIRNAIQGVTWKSSSNKIATVDEEGLVTCLKPGTVTITATAIDGSNKSVSFKLKVIKKIESLSMEDQTVKGGKSLNLLSMLEIDPTDATYNKTFTWEILGGEGAAYASIDAKGKLKTKKVTESMDVEIRVTAQDGSGEGAEFTVKINP